MQLPTLLPKEKSPSSELYWSVVIEPGWVQAGIWSVVEGKAETISVSPPVVWQEDGEVSGAVDTALSSAVQSLPPESSEPQSTVFGVPPSWISEGQIKDEYLAKIKVVCDELSLTPIGFVDLSEAIAFAKKTEEETPVNAFIIRTGVTEFEIALFSGGSKVKETVVARSLSLKNDLVEAFSRFGEGELPARIILFDGKEGELEEVAKELMTIAWSDYPQIKWLHPPKVDEITAAAKVQAVCLAGASEIGGVAVEEKVNPEAQNLTPISVGDAQGLGFVVNRDVAKSPQSFARPVVVEEPAVMSSGSSSQPSGLKRFFNPARLLRFLPHSLPKLPKRPVTGEKVSGKKLGIISVVVSVLLAVGGLAFWWWVPKAEVTIYLAPNKLEESLVVTLDPQAAGVSFEQKVLPGELTGQAESGEKTKTATGTKVVGEKAKGEVKLFRSGNEATLAAATKLTGPGGLVFSLDGETVIASGSAATPGTKVAGVTAEKIGSEYNLAGGSTFSVGNYPSSDIEAKNETAFSGGSSREISAISEDDLQSLEESLTKELLTKGKEDLLRSLDESEYFINESAVSQKPQKEFSGRVGDEATTLKLALSLEVQGLVVKKADLLAFTKEALKGKLPAGFTLREDQISFEFGEIKTTEGKYEVSLKLIGNLLPQVNADEIIAQIAGRYPPVARDYLTKIKGYSKVVFNLHPKLPGRLGTLPRIKKHLSIEFEAEK